MKKKNIFLLLLITTFLLTTIVLSGCSSPSENAVPDNGAENRKGEKTKIAAEENNEEPVAKETETPLKLTYLGHSTFLLENSITLLMDPHIPDFGTYGKINLTADIVTVSHEHDDHNYSQGGGEKAAVLRGLTGGDWNQVDHQLEDMRIYTVNNTYHGRNLGKNSIFVVETPDLRIVHLGDLGHTLEDSEKSSIGKVDILIIPVGGYYTLSPKEALEVIQQLSPSVVIPAHYKTAHNSNTPIGTLDDFLKLDIPYEVLSKNSTLQLTSKDLPQETEIWAMDYELP